MNDRPAYEQTLEEIQQMIRASRCKHMRCKLVTCWHYDPPQPTFVRPWRITYCMDCNETLRIVKT